MRVMILAAAAILAAAPALATDEEILALYEESGAAWAEGRLDDADRAGEAAWRQAEAEWGASEDTALLAEAVAQQRLMRGDRAGAHEPAARVAQLVADGAAPGLNAAYAALYVALAEFDPFAPTGEMTVGLQTALTEAEAAGMAPGQLLWSGWLDLARALVGAEEWEQAYTAGHNVINIMDLTAAVPDVARVEAAVLAGAAAMEARQYVDAEAAFEWALAYVPDYIVADGEEVLNPSWARLAVWASILNSANYSAGRDVLATGDVFDLDEMEAEQRCPGFQWLEREAPRYPDAAAQRGMVGAAIVEFEITPDGKAINPTTIAEAPENYGFGRAAENVVPRWQADPATVGNCTGKRLTTRFQFALQR